MNADPFRPFLEAQGFVVLDGGFATALEEAGHELGSDLWSARLLVDDPAAIGAAHTAYLEAGADCITSVSYQATVEGFRAIGCSAKEATDLLRSSTRLAVEARDAFWSTEGVGGGRLWPIVAASVGPYGAYLADGSEYDGRYGVGVDRLRDFHLPRFEALADSGADVMACETIPSAMEAEVLLRILDDAPDVWAWLSFSCRDASRLHDGSPFHDVIVECSRHDRVAGVGVNCTGPGLIADLLDVARGSCEVPLIAYANSGAEYDAGSKRWSSEADPAAWISHADAWIDAGARVVGGCCGIGPEMVRDLRARVSGRVSRTEEVRGGTIGS